MKLKCTSVYIGLYFNFMTCFRSHRSYGKRYSPFHVRFVINLGLLTPLNDLLGFQEAWRNFPANGTLPGNCRAYFVTNPKAKRDTLFRDGQAAIVCLKSTTIP